MLGTLVGRGPGLRIYRVGNLHAQALCERRGTWSYSVTFALSPDVVHSLAVTRDAFWNLVTRKENI